MTKSELGTKRVDPDTNKKFYDLNRDPIISPFTGKSYPVSFFETSPPISTMKASTPAANIIKAPPGDTSSDRSVDGEEDADDLPDLGDAEIEVDDEADDDTFLAVDDDEDDDKLDDIIGVKDDTDEL